MNTSLDTMSLRLSRKNDNVLDISCTVDSHEKISHAWGGGKIGSPMHIRSVGACIKSVELS